MDFNKKQQFKSSGHCFTACKKCPNVQHQTHNHTRETTAMDKATTHPTALLHINIDKSKRRERQKPLASTTYCQLGKNHDVMTEKLNLSIPSLLSCSKSSIFSLHSHCKYLEQENAAIMKKIIEMEDGRMNSASQLLQQYDRAESNIQAVQFWTDRQIKDGHGDVDVIRVLRKKREKALRLQLQACEEKIKAAQEDLHHLREYRDREHSVKVLEAAELERQLRVLNETHQDQAADVEALAHTETQKLLESQQTVKDAILQNVVEQELQFLPLSLKRMCLQNQELKQDIHAYQQMVAELQNEVLVLLKRGDSLRKSWKEETDRLCKDLLLGKPICTPDEDVILNIPLNQEMPI
ncbi:uncharacterized protein C20orf96 homolog isoform X2 [Pseudophryne corroboree]|uniref:uncharacterized protein C20orf96 homolog isoform X2 n=1 Tax=Pseudophryne corroboree TaxID=495146 RepID=UPI0030814A8D